MQESDSQKEADLVTRFFPRPTVGLTEEQAALRRRQGLVNRESGNRTKSYARIIRENTFTFFNLQNALLALAVLLVGSYRNLLFMGVILCNLVIGTVQGIRAKRTMDRLSLISAPHVRVVRSGIEKDIPVQELVLDDVMVLTAGRQICADGIVLSGKAEVNEALLTGESSPIVKQEGDSLLSGSFTVSGRCYARAEGVGDASYAAKLAKQAGYVSSPHSEILHSLNFIVRILGAILLPVGLFLFYRQYFTLHSDLQQAVVRTVAALIGMIPEGLILLTSIVFAVSVIRLSRHQTLTQNLYCSETLARVDVLCMDKTGTITAGTMRLDSLLPLPGFSEEDMQAAIRRLTAVLTDDNATFRAIRQAYPPVGEESPLSVIPFSSARKWSGASFAEESLVMGAGEQLLSQGFAPFSPLAATYAQEGRRVLLLAKTHCPLSCEAASLPQELQPMGLLILSDRIRPEAKDTLAYFQKQGVALKVISGDSAVTAAQIARRAGLPDWKSYINVTELEDDRALQQAATRYSVFGRVTPDQKLSLIHALQQKGHTVAMVGDGVNDVLSLKEADCGIAMASGSEAARTVSDLVLLDSSFASLPKVVEEGRRSINNLQRSASLFLTKTLFSTALGLCFLLIALPYPFHPIQMTLISALTIGIPSFILALEQNHELVYGRFLPNVLYKSIPTASGMLGSILTLTLLSHQILLSPEEFSTLAVYATAFSGFTLLWRLCIPFRPLRVMLFSCTVFLFLALTCFCGPFFLLVPLNTQSGWVLALSALASLLCTFLMDKLLFCLRTHPHWCSRLRKYFR